MRSIFRRAVTAPLALLLLAGGALAQGVVDQSNDLSSTLGCGCGSPTPILNGTILQGFVPTADNLIAVELRLQAGSAFPTEGTTTTARIRDGSSTGTVLGETTVSVAGPMSPQSQALVRFDFTPIALTPGNTYLIEWVTPPTTTLTWVGASTDPYAAGTAYSCSGNVWPGGTMDLSFITYAAEPEPEPEPEPEAPPTAADLFEQLRAAVIDLELRRCGQRAMERLLDHAERELERDRPAKASAYVLAVEWHVRLLDRLGVISDEEAANVITLAEAFRDSLGLESTKLGCGWHWKKSKRHCRS